MLQKNASLYLAGLTTNHNYRNLIQLTRNTLILKYAIIILIGLLLPVFSTHAQVHFGVKAGISPATSPVTDYIFVNKDGPARFFTFNTEKSYSQFHAGGFVSYHFDDFFVLGEIFYSDSKTDYLANFTDSDFDQVAYQTTLTETMSRLDLPVSIGVDLDPVEIFSGFTAHILLRHTTELTNLPGYSDSLNSLKFGWHTGLGLNIWHIHADIRYQLDFSNYGDHIFVNGQNLEFTNSPNKLIAMIGFRF
jgi:hypothetical protein